MELGGNSSFRVDEDGFTADGYRRLEPESRKSMYLSGIIAIVIVAAIFVSAARYAEAQSVVAGQGYLSYVALVLYVLTAIVIVYCLASPEIIYRRYRYRMDDEKIEVRKGVVYIVHEMVPIERIHQVDVREGPVNRMFGLADVQITTAGGSVTIEFLKADVARSIAQRLNDTVVGILKERV